MHLNVVCHLFLIQFIVDQLHVGLYFQVQIQGHQHGQMLGQVLQVPSGSHQQLQGVTTAQLIQPGELTEEQHQQVYFCTHMHNKIAALLICHQLPVFIFLPFVVAASPVGGSCCRRTADPNPDSGGPLSHTTAGQCREKDTGNYGCHIPGSRCPPASQEA